MTAEQEKLIEEIIAYELEMFLAVQNLGGTANCQQHPNAFKTMRKMSHSVQNTAFLQSYLNDLKQAKEEQRNFMVEKYALMDNLIPALSSDERIGIIVEKEAAWRNIVAAVYPHVIRHEDSTHFKNYLQGELQTLSPESLAFYYENVMQADKEGRNLIQERYAYLINLLGYSSIEEYEKKLANNTK